MPEAPTFELFTSLRYDPLLVKVKANIALFDADALGSATSSGSPFYILSYHRDRILQAAEHFGWEDAATKIKGPQGLAFLLKHLEAAILDNATKPLRVKVLLDHEGSVRVETSPAAPVTEFNLFPARLPPPKDAEPLKVSSLTGGALSLGDGDAVYGDPPTADAWDILIDTVQTEPSAYTSYKTTSRNMYDSARKHVGIRDFTEPREVLLVSSTGGAIMEGSLTTVYFWRNGKWVTPKIEDGGQIGTTRRWALSKR
jgi:4-amino-4-deoxychorismate lyase